MRESIKSGFSWVLFITKGMCSLLRTSNPSAKLAIQATFEDLINNALVISVGIKVFFYRQFEYLYLNLSIN